MAVGRLGAIVGALAVGMGLLAAPNASAAPVDGRRAEMQQLLHAIRADFTAPGVGITFGNGDHDTTMTSGSSKFGLERTPIKSTDKVRVGSDTKMFTASVVLQLVGENRLQLDVPVDRYVPGLLRYPIRKSPANAAAYDGRTVTVRQLLQHNGGVPDFADLPYILNPAHQAVPPTSQDLVNHGLRNGPAYRPGTAWGYSNTDYVLLGMIVKAVTGRSIGSQIEDRIVKPLHLRNTFYATTKRRIPGPHVRGYVSSTVPFDVTYFQPAVWDAAGALVSSADDMNTFMSGLLAGKVLSPPMLAEMQRTVPYLTGGYGLGIVSVPMSCGVAWGHAGQVAGYSTFGLALPNGRHSFLTMNMTYAINLIPLDHPPASITRLFELALC